MATLIERTVIVKALQSTITDYSAVLDTYDKWEAKRERLQGIFDTRQKDITDWLRGKPMYYSEWNVTAGRYGYSDDTLFVDPAYGAATTKPEVPADLAEKFMASVKALTDHRKEMPNTINSADMAQLKAYLLKFENMSGATVSVPDRVIDILPSAALQF